MELVPDIMRRRVDVLQRELAALPQYEPKTEHFFHGGMYCRKVTRKEGVLVVGRVHKQEHLYVIVTGRLLVTDGASEPVECRAGDVILSMPGTKRAVLSLEPSVCMTFHKTDARTVEEAERELVEEDPTALFDHDNRLKLEAIK